jgi:hypothetical protein
LLEIRRRRFTFDQDTGLVNFDATEEEEELAYLIRVDASPLMETNISKK